MPIRGKQGGTWREISDPQVKVGGTWRDVQFGYTKVSGEWRVVHPSEGTPIEYRSAGSYTYTWNNFYQRARIEIRGGQGGSRRTTGSLSPWDTTAYSTKSLPNVDWEGLSISGSTLYVLDDTNNRIARYTSWSDGSPDYKNLPSGIEWGGVSVDGSTLYVLDDTNNRIARYTSWSDGSPDYKNLPSDTWKGISVTGGTIYVHDSGGGLIRIARYTSWSDSSPDYKNLGAGGYHGMASTSNGYLYVIDTSNDRISRFTSWSDSSADSKSLPSLIYRGMAVDSSNRIYALDDTNNRVIRYSSSFTYSSGNSGQTSRVIYSGSTYTSAGTAGTSTTSDGATPSVTTQIISGLSTGDTFNITVGNGGDSSAQDGYVVITPIV